MTTKNRDQKQDVNDDNDPKKISIRYGSASAKEKWEVIEYVALCRNCESIVFCFTPPGQLLASSRHFFFPQEINKLIIVSDMMNPVVWHR